MIVFEYKACDLNYFLDVLQPYELDMILSMLEYNKKQDWEQTRYLSYITAQSQSTKKLQITDVLKFSWDNEATNKENKNTTITKEDIDRLKRKAEKIIQDKQLNK